MSCAPENRKRVLIEYLLIATALLVPVAILQILLRTQLVSLVYMRGKFSAADLAGGLQLHSRLGAVRAGNDCELSSGKV